MSYICGDCHQEHPILKNETRAHCVDALRAKLSATLLQLREAEKEMDRLRSLSEGDPALVHTLTTERDVALRLNGELKDILARAAVAMETAECHGQHEDCIRCERIQWIRSKIEKRKHEPDCDCGARVGDPHYKGCPLYSEYEKS